MARPTIKHLLPLHFKHFISAIEQENVERTVYVFVKTSQGKQRLQNIVKLSKLLLSRETEKITIYKCMILVSPCFLFFSEPSAAQRFITSRPNVLRTVLEMNSKDSSLHCTATKAQNWSVQVLSALRQSHLRQQTHSDCMYFRKSYGPVSATLARVFICSLTIFSLAKIKETFYVLTILYLY